MFTRSSAPFACLVLCGAMLAMQTGFAWGQTATSPPAGTLQAPAKPSSPASPQSSVKPAPREPVRQVGPKPPPVIQPHGTPHAQKPPAGQKTAKPPANAPPAVPVPTPVEPPKAPEMPDKGAATGLPLPRFAALRSDEVNLRAGPGTRYPIEWVYKRRELPVEISREFEVWRLVRDPDGTKGWVHSATLTGRRSFIVTGGDATMRRSAQDNASAVAILKSGVIGHIRSCEAASDWCQVQVGDYRGFLKRSQFWGTLPGEVVAN